MNEELYYDCVREKSKEGRKETKIISKHFFILWSRVKMSRKSRLIDLELLRVK